METKDFAFDTMEVKDDEQGIIEGYASTFGNVDSYDDTVAKGAFAKTIKERLPKIRMLWQHEMDNPIGRTLSAVEDRKGLLVTGQFTRGVRQAEEAFLHFKAGSLDSFSIGYSAVKYSIDEETHIRTLKEIKLYEWSAVSFPADEHAMMTDVKDAEIDLDELIRKLERKTTLTPEQLKDAADRILALIEREPGKSTHDDEPHRNSGEPPVDGYSLHDLLRIATE